VQRLEEVVGVQFELGNLEPYVPTVQEHDQ
jgi:hypothetical protein